MILTHRKFNDDIFARFLVIIKNVVISFIKEYWGQTLRLACDVIDDVIIMNKTFLGIIWHNLERSFHIWGQIEAVFNNSKFSKMDAILSSRQTFSPEVIPKFEYARKIAISISDILSFWSTLYLEYWRRYINFKIWLLWPGDVINDVMSAWNITCTTRHPKQYNCKIWFVWHQSFIVKSSGQTSWQT